jgi:hypothetical protein
MKTNKRSRIQRVYFEFRYIYEILGSHGSCYSMYIACSSVTFQKNLLPSSPRYPKDVDSRFLHIADNDLLGYPDITP